MSKTANIIYKSLISPLGFTLEESFNAICKGNSGIKFHENIPFIDGVYASIVNNNLLDEVFSAYGEPKNYTKLEKLSIIAIKKLIDDLNIDVTRKRTLLIYSTTKGNAEIKVLDKNYIPRKRFLLLELTKVLENYFEFGNSPIIISNACVSGTQAIILADNLIKSGAYDDVIIVGGDIVSSFNLTGFKALNALSNVICKPFDRERKGINIGECCGALVISNRCNPENKYGKLIAGSSTVDAHHLVAPSREGTGLTQAIKNCISNIDAPIDFIVAHGTATVYNDEMEALSINNNGLSDVPLFSVKGYLGHTLGAAGILETLIGLQCLESEIIIPSKGYTQKGISNDINIVTELKNKKSKTFLKTASGFGGVNAAIVIEK